MTSPQINRLSSMGLVTLSLAALLLVLSAVVPIWLSGHVPPPAQDEGTRAHIFQLLIVALLPTGLLFLTSADWTQPFRNVRRLAFPAIAVIAAFVLLYYFEHLPAS